MQTDLSRSCCVVTSPSGVVITPSMRAPLAPRSVAGTAVPCLGQFFLNFQFLNLSLYWCLLNDFQSSACPRLRFIASAYVPSKKSLSCHFVLYSAHSIAFGNIQVVKQFLVLVPDMCWYTFWPGLSHFILICEEYWSITGRGETIIYNLLISPVNPIILGWLAVLSFVEEGSDRNLHTFTLNPWWWLSVTRYSSVAGANRFGQSHERRINITAALFFQPRKFGKPHFTLPIDL